LIAGLFTAEGDARSASTPTSTTTLIHRANGGIGFSPVQTWSTAWRKRRETDTAFKVHGGRFLQADRRAGAESVYNHAIPA